MRKSSIQLLREKLWFITTVTGKDSMQFPFMHQEIKFSVAYLHAV